MPFESIENSSSYSMDFTFYENSIIAYLATPDLGVISYEIDTTTLANPNFNANEKALIIYPNPVTSIVNIALANGNTPSKIAVYTYTCKKVLEISQQDKIDLTNLSKGVCFLRILGKDGNIYIKKIIKE